MQDGQILGGLDFEAAEDAGDLLGFLDLSQLLLEPVPRLRLPRQVGLEGRAALLALIVTVCLGAHAGVGMGITWSFVARGFERWREDSSFFVARFGG